MSEEGHSRTQQRHRAGKKSGLPGSEPVKNALWRVLGAACLLAAAMFGGLQWAKRYAAKDWGELVQEAREKGRPAPAPEEPAVAVPADRGWRAGAERWGWLGGDGGAWWMAAARGVRAGAAARRRGILLAQSWGADEAEVQNALGALELGSGRAGPAMRHFGMALAAKPGYALSLYNRSLCEARLGMKAEALGDAAAYCARHPAEEGALRLLAALLCEEGRDTEALALLERGLAGGAGAGLHLDAAELAARKGWGTAALLHLDAAAEGGAGLGRVARTYKGPLFDSVRTTDEGRAFTHRLAARWRGRGEEAP